MEKRIDKEELVNQFKILAMAYGLKVMANDLDKAYSSLSNELDERDWAKLGLRTAVSMLEQVLVVNPRSAQAKLAANRILDMIAAGFGRVMYALPDHTKDHYPIVRILAEMSKEYAETIGAMAEALADGKWSADELDRCQQENREMVKACLRLEYFINDLRGSAKQ